jgi:hypothetical protein
VEFLILKGAKVDRANYAGMVQYNGEEAQLGKISFPFPQTPFLHACRFDYKFFFINFSFPNNLCSEGHQDVVALLANHGANIHATKSI